MLAQDLVINRIDLLCMFGQSMRTVCLVFGRSGVRGHVLSAVPPWRERLTPRASDCFIEHQRKSKELENGQRKWTCGSREHYSHSVSGESLEAARKAIQVEELIQTHASRSRLGPGYTHSYTSPPGSYSCFARSLFRSLQLKYGVKSENRTRVFTLYSD